VKRGGGLHRRVRGRRTQEAGLTLIELLVSLALLAVLTAFLAGGLMFGRRGFKADRNAGIETEADEAINVISRLIGSAFPVQIDAERAIRAAAFDGGEEAISFIGLSGGHGLSGGPARFNVKCDGGDLVIHVSGSRAEAGELVAPIAVLGGVRSVQFGYFGKAASAGQPGWQTEWHDSDHLPYLVSIKINFKDERRDQPPVLVALRQEKTG